MRPQRVSTTYTIPDVLLEDTKLNAADCQLRIGSYALVSIRLLDYASSHGFSAQKTSLLRPSDNIAVPLPRLAEVPQQPTSPLPVRLERMEKEQLEQKAQAQGISTSERVRRGLRLLNFVYINNGWPEATFVHMDDHEDHTVDLRTLYERS